MSPVEDEPLSAIFTGSSNTNTWLSNLATSELLPTSEIEKEGYSFPDVFYFVP